jgi:hypothetical protein
MKKKKKFDCVDMKNTIQAQHAEQYKGMTDEERWNSVNDRLAHSQDKLARKWRSIKNESPYPTFDCGFIHEPDPPKPTRKKRND